MKFSLSRQRFLVSIIWTAISLSFLHSFATGREPKILLPPLDGQQPLAAPLSDDQLLEKAGVKTDGPGLVEFFKKATLSEEDTRHIEQMIRRLGDEDFEVREKASRDLVALGYKVHAFLRRARNQSGDPEIADRAAVCLKELGADQSLPLPIAAARLLATRPADGAVTVLLNFLPHAESELVEDEVIGTIGKLGVKEGKPDPILVQAIQDRRPICRLAAAETLGSLADAEIRKAIRGLLSDSDARVRFRAARSLIDGKDKEAVPTLLALLTDAPHHLAWQAEAVLFHISGEKAPSFALGSTDAERKKCRDSWEAWWKAEEAKIDLAKLDPRNRYLGLMLVCVFDNNNGGMGRIVEYGADGKPRWEISNLHGPIDAQVLPGHRILYAEHNRFQVVEREIGGKVLWVYQDQSGRNIVACQRLPNGNTLFATYNSIHEITPDRKESVNISISNHSIYHARKLSDGTYAAVSSNGTVLFYDGKGTLKKQTNAEPLSGWITLDVVAGNRVLVPYQNKVVEFDSEGRETATFKVPKPFGTSASRTPVGNYVVGFQRECCVREYDRDGKELVTIRLDGRPFWAKKR